MTTPWLKEYVLDTLGSELRKGERPGTRYEPAGKKSARDRAQLVQIIGRGQGERLEGDSSLGQSTPLGQYWWDVQRRGKSPNLSKQLDAWLLISDGCHSLKVYFTIGGLKQVFDWDNRNQNDDSIFRPGSCILLKQYSIEFEDTTPIGKNNISLLFKVSSLEPKPGFNNHLGTTNRGNNTASGGNARLSPVLEEIDVSYGLQYLCLKKRGEKNGTNSGAGSTNSKSIVREWEIAFGRLSKGLLTTPMEPIGDNANLNNVLELAEQLASTDEAIQDWELAKQEFGIGSDADDFENAVDCTRFSRNNDVQAGVTEDHLEETQNDSDEDEEDLSMLFIQNVLGMEEEEKEDGSENQEASEHEDRSSQSEEQPLLDTQPALVTAVEDKNHSSKNEISETNISTRRKEKRIRSNSFEGDNLGSADKSGRKREHKLLSRDHRDHQQHSQNSTGSIWDSVKEQIFEPGRTVVHCIPSFRMPSSSDNSIADGEFPATPQNQSEKRIRTPFSLGSAVSMGASVSTTAGSPSSGAYFRKYGLARWLSQNSKVHGRKEGIDANDDTENPTDQTSGKNKYDSGDHYSIVI